MSSPIKKDEFIQGDFIEEIKKGFEDSLSALDQYDKSLKSIATTMSGEFAKTQKATIQNIEKLNKLDLQSEKLAKQKLQTEQQKIRVTEQQKKALIAEERLKQSKLRTDQQLRREAERQEKQQKKLAKDLADQNNAYKKLSRSSLEYKNRSKRLGAELLLLEQSGKKNNRTWTETKRRYDEATRQAQITDKQLKKLDATVGDHQRKVGNYSKALNGASRALGQLGIAMGVGAVAKGIFDFNKNLSKATNQAQTLFEVSEEGAKQIAQDATIIAKAYGKDVNEVLKAGNVLQRQFGVSSEQSFEILNRGFEKGADVSGELLENINEYSTQLRLAGLNAEQSISIITQSQQQGVFSDKGIDAIKEATLSLREMTPAAAEALDAIGMSAEQVQRDIASGSKTYFDVIQEIAARTNDIGENTQAAGLILADVFKGAGEDAGDFIFSLGEMNTELNDLEDTNKGVEGAIQNLTKEFYELVFGVNESLNVTGLFSGAINFLADNLGTIIGLIPRLLAYWVVYANRVKIARAEQFLFNGGLVKTIRNIPKMIKGLKMSSLSFKSLGASMKSIPFVAIIALIVELVSWLWNTADATDAVTDAENASTDAYKKGNEARAERISQQKTIEDQVKMANSLTQTQLKLLRDKIKAQIDDTESNDLAIKTAKEVIDQNKNETKEIRNKIDALREKRREMTLDADASLDEINAITDKIKQLQKEDVRLKENQKLRAQGLELTDNEIERRNKLQKQLAIILPLIKEETRERPKITRETKKQNEVVEEQIDLWQEYIDQIKKVREQQDLMSIDIDEDSLIGDAPSLTEPMNKALDETRKIYNIQETDLINSLRKREITQSQFDQRMLDMKLERLRKEREIMYVHGEDITEIDKQIARTLLDQNLKAQEEYFEQVAQIAQKANEILQDQFDSRMQMEQDKADAAKREQDRIIAFAAEGNDKANESLKAQIQAERDALNEKERIRKQKERAEFITTALQNVQNQLANGATATEAIGSTVALEAALRALFAGFQGFYKGTDNAPEGFAWLHEKGGEAVLDKKGRLKEIGSNIGPQLRYLDKGDKVIPHKKTMDILNSHSNLEGASKVAKQMTYGSDGGAELLREMKRNNQLLKRIPQNALSAERIGNIIKMISTERKAGRTRINTFKIKG